MSAVRCVANPQALVKGGAGLGRSASSAVIDAKNPRLFRYDPARGDNASW